MQPELRKLCHEQTTDGGEVLFVTIPQAGWERVTGIGYLQPYEGAGTDAARLAASWNALRGLTVEQIEALDVAAIQQAVKAADAYDPDCVPRHLRKALKMLEAADA